MGEVIYSCQRRQGKVHPVWSKNSVIYELNVRQFTPDGTFNAAQQHLERLKGLGVGIIWVMPIFPIGKDRRKGSLGSYYSIADFRGVNEEFGNFADFVEFVEAAHNQGIKVIMDWVTNHTARDAKWVTEHPNWYVWEGEEIATPFDWSDTAKLDYDNFDMRKEMCESMKYWLLKAGVDGFRMDMAMLVPLDFWQVTIKELESVKSDIFMLAEAQGSEFHRVGFDATYSWDMHHLFNSIARQEAGVDQLCDLLKRESIDYPSDAIRMQFTSNHDENSWNGTEFERLGGAVDTFAALSYVINGMPLIYSGQEVKLQRRLEFFDKDCIDWSDYKSNNLYNYLGNLKQNEALACDKDGADVVRMDSDERWRVFAVKRKVGDRVVIGLFNLSGHEAWFKVYDDDFNGVFNQVGSCQSAVLESGKDFLLQSWGWFIYYK